MTRRLIAVTSGLLLAVALVAGPVAAGNPSGTGQPGAECGDAGATMEPHGFSTGGFAKAEGHYAGSDGTASLAHAASAHAVSQYDVACFQVTQHH
jgi:hypothetical protein